MNGPQLTAIRPFVVGIRVCEMPFSLHPYVNHVMKKAIGCKISLGNSQIRTSLLILRWTQDG